jgi:hypothetical protein
MGELYLARLEREAGFAKTLVIKRILPALSQDAAFVEMFKREACIAAQLNHENVVQIFDYGQHDGSYFIAMEYVHGRDLRSLLDAVAASGQALDPGLAAAILLKLCQGLDYAHRRKDPEGRPLHLVHRDVSPQNILLSYEGEVKLTDFGLARREGLDAEAAGVVQGKFAYMSPEQTWGAALDRRSDLFSLGVIAYELFCGQRPWAASELHGLVRAIRAGRLEPASARRPALPSALDPILARALAVEPDARYPDARALRADLEALALSQGWRAGGEALGALVAARCPDLASATTPREGGTAAAAAPIAGLERTAAALQPVLTRTVTAADPAAALDSAPRAVAPRADPPRRPRVGLLALAALIALAAALGWQLQAARSPRRAELLPREAPRQDAASPAPRGDEGAQPPGAAFDPEAAQGQVILYVLPNDAQVQLAGAPLQPQEPPTPGEPARYELTRAPGEVPLEITREGYQPLRQAVLVPTRTTLSQNLQLKALPVRVEVRPARAHLGRVTIEAADGYRTECGLPCVARVPTPGEVRVNVTLDGRQDVKPWGAARHAEGGERLLFTVPIPEPPAAPEARLRAQLSGADAQGSTRRVALLDADLLQKSSGTRRAQWEGGPAVTLRYEYTPDGRLSISLASDPWSAVSLDGAAIGQTPVVNRPLSPGHHRLQLGTHGLTLTLRYVQSR